MYSNLKWISKLMLLGLGVAVFASTASAQEPRANALRRSFVPAADAARDMFNAGLQFYDQSQYADAERKFREVVQRFPKNTIADRAEYYLIRTLMQAGKTPQALNLINGFARRYPQLTWTADVQEAKIQLTNQVPPRAEFLLLRQTPPAPPAPPAAPRAPGAPALSAPPSPLGIGPDFNAAIRASIDTGLEGLGASLRALSMRFGEPQSTDPELSLKQEIMRAEFRNDPDRAITIQEELLKSNPADPLVLSTLNMLATSQSPKALPMLLEIAKNSSNPKARKDAIYWISQSRGDKDAIVDTLTGLLQTTNADDSEAVAFALGQVRTDKAVNALAGIARDKNRAEGMRTSAVQGIGQSRVPNRVALLEDIYKNSSDSLPIRRQVLSALGQARDPQAVALLGNIASSDASIELRKQAVLSLGQIKSPEASQALENLLLKK